MIANAKKGCESGNSKKGKKFCGYQILSPYL